MGKSFVLAFIAAFLTVFGKLYFNSENEKFWVILCSYRETDGVDKIFEEAHQYLTPMIEQYNGIYYDKPIFTGKYVHNAVTYNAVDKVSDLKTELNIIIENQVRPYSIMLGLTTGTKNDGASMDWGWLDEGQATSFEEFDRSIDPFRTSTGSNLIVSGISSTDSANVQHFVHFNESSIKTKLIYPVAYNFIKLTHPSRAEKMKGYVESKIEALGIDSTNIQTNYFLNWETLDGKFYTKQLMEKNNNFGSMFKEKDMTALYRVGGLDLSTSHDYTVLTIMDIFSDTEAVYNENINKYESVSRWRCELRAIETYNIDQKKMSSEKVAEDTAKFCNYYQIDMLLADGTSMQETYIEWIIKKINEKGINTLVVDYNFSGSANKVLLMSNLEDMLYSQRLKLGSKEQLLTDWSWKKLYEEMLYLIRENKKGKNNIQWYAPKSKGFTDDHVMSLALSAYCVPYIEKLYNERKYIEIGNMKYKARFNKFLEVSKDKKDIKKCSTWMNVR